ncbi:hypothetical protein BDF21DRAFT_497829 [Thamnidium elegans]|nr:hypothetical protein BDF21DRAFT_497829 [Thamnidium elegans]
MRGVLPQPERESDTRSFKREVYYNYLQIMLQQPHITKRLEEEQKNKIFELAQQDNYDDNKLVHNLRGKFGQDAILVFGDWSAPNTKFHKPTRNKNLIAMLKKNGFTVYLVNEYKTSSFCPGCEHALEIFKTVPNPRPFK